MRKFTTILALLTLFNYSRAQESFFKLASMMDGKHQLESGNKIDVWGYGWDTLTPVVEIPAPLLEIAENDSVTIRFRNISPEAHTIHLHGLDVNQVNDGVPSTSFHVWNGDTAHYKFKADYSGTYLYHCHVTTTLHLAMGMYGMIVVNRPDSLLFASGPKYDKQHYFLTSDSDTNLIPISPPPFNEIEPNYFMINGQRGSMLNDDTIKITNDENIVLRLANVAYAKVKYIFPENVRATVYMSDGRKLPQSFETDTLELYSGERFSVVLNSDMNLDDFVQVEYYNTVKNELKYTNKIPVKSTQNSLTINEISGADIEVYPNPFKNRIKIKKPLKGFYHLYNSNLKLLNAFYLDDKNNQILVEKDTPRGLYFLVSPSGNSFKLIKN